MWGQIHCITICRRLMNTKLGKVLTYSERLPSLKPHDPLIILSMREFWKILFPLSEDLWPVRLLMGGGSARKCFSHHQLAFNSKYHCANFLKKSKEQIASSTSFRWMQRRTDTYTNKHELIEPFQLKLEFQKVTVFNDVDNVDMITVFREKNLFSWYIDI